MHTHTHTHTHKRKYHKLLMPEVNLGLQVASSLLLLLHPALPLLPCPLQPAFSFAVRLLGLSNAHNKLFVPLEGPLGFFPFMLAKVSLLHTFDFMFHVSRGNSPFVYLRVVTGFSQASAQMPTEAYIAMKSYLILACDVKSDFIYKGQVFPTHPQKAAREHEHAPHVPPSKFYTHEIPISIVPVLNLAAYWYLCGGRLWRED